MTDTRTRIAAGLERAFAREGFARPNVETLREAADVSLRTLYKYAPSREAMVHLALEHRHGRYLGRLFDDPPEETEAVLPALLDRIAAWMASEASHGCLFHAAVAAAPRDERLRALLERHKAEVAERAARLARLPGREVEITLVFEGLTQTWPLSGDAATLGAKRLAAALGGLPDGDGPHGA